MSWPIAASPTSCPAGSAARSWRATWWSIKHAKDGATSFVAAGPAGGRVSRQRVFDDGVGKCLFTPVECAQGLGKRIAHRHQPGPLTRLYKRGAGYFANSTQ